MLFLGWNLCIICYAGHVESLSGNEHKMYDKNNSMRRGSKERVPKTAKSPAFRGLSGLPVDFHSSGYPDPPFTSPSETYILRTRRSYHEDSEGPHRSDFRTKEGDRSQHRGEPHSLQQLPHRMPSSIRFHQETSLRVRSQQHRDQDEEEQFIRRGCVFNHA